jgi:hypothetical protein
MDENTKALVASNLVNAFVVERSTRQSTRAQLEQGFGELKDIVDYYRQIYELLGSGSAGTNSPT